MVGDGWNWLPVCTAQLLSVADCACRSPATTCVTWVPAPGKPALHPSHLFKGVQDPRLQRLLLVGEEGVVADGHDLAARRGAARRGHGQGGPSQQHTAQAGRWGSAAWRAGWWARRRRCRPRALAWPGGAGLHEGTLGKLCVRITAHLRQDRTRSRHKCRCMAKSASCHAELLVRVLWQPPYARSTTCPSVMVLH